MRSGETPVFAVAFAVAFAFAFAFALALAHPTKPCHLDRSVTPLFL
jgi:hypothetical protein